jgi:hypothetical protein
VRYDQIAVRWALGETIVGAEPDENGRMAFAEDATLLTEAAAISYGERWLADHAETLDQFTVGVLPNRDATTPYRGVGKGDRITARDRDFVDLDMRIHSVALMGMRRNGDAEWAYTLSSRKQEALVARERELARLGASMSGSFGSATPNPAPSYAGLSNSALPITELPLADTDSFTTEEPYDRTAFYRFKENTSIIRFQCQADSIVPDNPLDDPGDWTYTNTVFQLWKIVLSGDSVVSETALETITWPGERRMLQHFCNRPFVTDDNYQLRVTQAGSHGLASIQPIGSTIN